MKIEASDIKKLRDTTGAGMMDAKKALEEAKGDFEKAIEVLRKKGQAKAQKRAERQADAGIVFAYVHMDRVGAMVEINCETDFVARTEDFKQFVLDVAMQVAASSPKYIGPGDIPAEVVKKEKEIYAEELKGKPEAMVEQIVEGKLEKFYEQVCLMNQPFIKDQDKTINGYQAELITKLGENIRISRFSRFELGVRD